MNTTTTTTTTTAQQQAALLAAFSAVAVNAAFAAGVSLAAVGRHLRVREVLSA